MREGEIAPIAHVRQAFAAGLQYIEQLRVAGEPAGYDSEEDEPRSATAQWLTIHDAWVEFTNFTKDQVESIWRPLNDSMMAERHRGPQAISTTMDQLIHYLMWLKTGMNYATLSKLVGLKGTSRIEDNINRVRGHLIHTLSAKWWTNRRRPRFFDDNRFPMVGLIVDAHTIQICPPKMNHRDAKVYFDGKNRVYGFKTEVAVMRQPPHYCLFVSDSVPASKHDYELHKEICHQYLDYLHLTEEEHAHVNNDPNRQFWPILADKGYTGPAEDTHPIKRIVPYKNAFLNEQVQFNAALNPIRVVVEQFFGRCTTLFATTAKPWRWDWSHFDDDWKISCLLANEHIQAHALAQEDATLQLGLLRVRLTRHQEQQRKKKAQTARSRQRTAERLAQFGPYAGRRNAHDLY